MRFIAVFLFLGIASAAFADLDRAIDAYNADDFERAATEAVKALDQTLSQENELLAKEIHLSSRYFMGETGTRLRDEIQAFDTALSAYYGQDSLNRLGVLFILSDLNFQLGAVDAAIAVDALTARIALKHPQDALEDLLWAVRNMAIAFDTDDGDAVKAVFFAALFEFFATDALGFDAPLAQEAVALSALSLLRAGEDTRAAQKFFLYDFDAWERFAAQGPDENALTTRLMNGLDTLPIEDIDMWMAEVQRVHDAYLEREQQAADIGYLVEQGQLDFASPFYLEALEKMERYLAIAHPEDPLAAIFVNMILKSRLDIGDYGGARSYLGGSCPIPLNTLPFSICPSGNWPARLRCAAGSKMRCLNPF